MQRKTAKKARGAKASYSSPAVEKAADVIAFLATQRDGVSITTISEGIGRSVGEIYRVVLALQGRNFIYKHPATDRFQLSLRLFELANMHPRVERLISVAQVELDYVAGKTLQSCHLAVAEGRKIIIIASKESPLPMHYSVKTGSSFDIFETSSGAVIAAHLPAAQQDFLLGQARPAERRALQARFARIKKSGHELRNSAVVRGLTNISVPVSSTAGKIVGALTVPYLKQADAAIGPQAVLGVQLAAGRRLSRSLG